MRFEELLAALGIHHDEPAPNPRRLAYEMPHWTLSHIRSKIGDPVSMHPGGEEPTRLFYTVDEGKAMIFGWVGDGTVIRDGSVIFVGPETSQEP